MEGAGNRALQPIFLKVEVEDEKSIFARFANPMLLYLDLHRPGESRNRGCKVCHPNHLYCELAIIHRDNGALSQRTILFYVRCRMTIFQSFIKYIKQYVQHVDRTFAALLRFPKKGAPQDQIFDWLKSVSTLHFTIILPFVVLGYLIVTIKTWISYVALFALLAFVFSDEIKTVLHGSNRQKSLVISDYAEMLYETVWHILYRSGNLFPHLKRPSYPTDLQVRIGNDTTISFTLLKTSTALLDRDIVEDYRLLLQSLLDVQLFPKDVYGRYIPSPLTENGIHFKVVRCVDEGRYFSIVIVIGSLHDDVIGGSTLNAANLNTQDIELWDDEI